MLQIDRTILKGRDLSRCQLSYVDFKNCNLINTKFQNANLSNCSFNRTVLSAIFQGINFENANLDLHLFEELKDIKFLKEFKGLPQLDLSHSQVTDISPLRELKNLTGLELLDNQITNFSVLKELKNLRHLRICEYHMDEKQKAGLKEAIPGLGIHELEEFDERVL